MFSIFVLSNRKAMKKLFLMLVLLLGVGEVQAIGLIENSNHLRIESKKKKIKAGESIDSKIAVDAENQEGIFEKVYHSAKNMVVKFFVLLFGGLLDFTFEDKISEVPPNAKQIYCETKS